MGREIAARTQLPFKIIEEILEVLKRQLLVEVRSAGGLADYEYTPTEKGRDRARSISTTMRTTAPALYRGHVM